MGSLSEKQARKGFRPPGAMKGIGYFQNLRNGLRNFLGNFLGGSFCKNFFDVIFLEKFFGRIFFGRIFLGGIVV